MADIVSAMFVTTTIAIFLVLIVQPPIEQSYRLTTDGQNVFIGSKMLGRHVSSTILKPRSRMKTICQIMVAQIVVIAIGYFEFCVWYINGNSSKLSIPSIYYWAVLFPKSVVYFTVAHFWVSASVFLASNYIAIIQKDLISKLQVFERDLKRTRFSSWKTQYEYVQLNQSLIDISKMTSVYSHNCTFTLSIIIPFYVCTQCYYSYVLLFKKAISMSEKYFFFFADLENNFFLFLLVNQCAAVTRNNLQFELINRKIAFLLMKCPKQVGYLIKIEAFQESRRFRSYSFRIFGHYRITSKTFFLVNKYRFEFIFFCKREFISDNVIYQHILHVCQRYSILKFTSRVRNLPDNSR